jgi:diguanylate cyclase (GGDEF)-like protein/putative nucleotidyltransferase with HDIG domain
MRKKELDPPAEDDRQRATGGGVAAFSVETSVRLMGLIYLVGGSFALAIVLIAQFKHLGELSGLVAAAYAIGFGLFFGRRRLPAVAIDLAFAAGTVIVTLAINILGHSSEQVFSIFYVWTSLNAAFLLSRRRAAAQVALIALAYGLYLLGVDTGARLLAQQWLLTVATCLMTGGLVAILKLRVERLIDDLAETARRDSHTGLLSGNGFEESLDRELERAQRGGSSLSVIVVDLDNFKEANEELGHRVADERLTIVARVLESAKRRIDTVARMGGEEFALVLPQTDEHGAYVLADRLRRAIRDHFGGDSIATTASLGVASFPKHGSSFEELFGAASQAVYAAKELGRDRSVIYNPEITANLRSAAVREDLQSEEHLAAVIVLAETLDMRDQGTARHSETVGRYAKQIAAEMGMTPREVERVHLAGMLHDIGKIGISDTILQKPGALSNAEWDEMRKHPELGSRILDGARLEDISAWVRAHHERPDGGGYPLGLDDERIPVQAKILAVADSYEAMTADRVYKPGLSEEAAREELLRCAGGQFDPAVVLAFINVLSGKPAVREAAA